jgi:signal transduction histidine kinase
MNDSVSILLVDDEARNLDALEAILARPDYLLLRAQDADSALRLLLDHDVAAIVLDIQMPSVGGFELAQMIKTTKRFRDTPIVFLTAFMLDEQHVAAGYGAGAVDYMTKPFNPQILQQKIAVFAELFRKTRALGVLNATLEERVRERTAELQKSEAALRASSEQKDEFLAVLAHELRNPLAPLRMGLDVVMMERERTPLVERTLAAMDRQLRHMVRLIDDLLDVSRLSRGVLELKMGVVDLSAVVRGAAETFAPLAQQRGQVLELAIEPEIRARVDATRVAQVVGNLLHNSNKFTPEGGHIRVELMRQGEDAVVRVRDSGIGIPEGEEEHVFQMFTRIAREEGAVQSGLGIGLSLARRLAVMHGGTLSVDRAGAAPGSIFTLTLPVGVSAEGAPVVEDAQSSEPTESGVRRVLIIEDNDDVADTLADWMQLHGQRVFVARSGQEGVAEVARLEPDVVLCDLGMPGMDGFEVCRRIRATELATQPFLVALTGWGRDEDRKKTREAGFDQHIVKPAAPEDLERILAFAPAAAQRRSAR